MKFWHDCCGLGDPAADLYLQRERAWDGRSEVGEIIHSLQHVLVDGDCWEVVCALRHDVTFVFFKLMVNLNSLQAWKNWLTSCCRQSSVCDARAASSAKSISRISTSVTLVLAGRRAMLKSLPSALVWMYTPSLQSLKAYWRSMEKNM